MKRKLQCPDSSGPIKKKVCKSPGDKVTNQKVPFWSDLSTKWSDMLISCSQSRSENVTLESWSQSFRNLAQNSWFSVKGQKLRENLKQSFIDQVLHQTLQENISDDTDMKAMKIRIFPNKKQKQIFSKWFGTCRWTYNQCVNSFQTKISTANKKELRAKHINNDNFEDENTWVPETPYDIRDEAMNDFLKALKATKAKKDLNHFQFKYRSKKDNTQSIAVLKKHWGHKKGIYADVLNADKMKSERELPETLNYDSRIIKTRLDQYYLCIPKPIEVRSENQAPDEKKHCTISLDPGVRTFMTGYDADGSTFEWGQNDFGRVFRLCYSYDRLQAKWSEKPVKHHQRYKMKIAARRIQRKIRNLIDEVHKKLTKCLCENYRAIVLPKFETSTMVRRGDRKLHKKTARAMLTWSHYRFRQRLLSKSREYPWCNIIVTEEPYTSKTCGKCGTINTKLGSSKIFRCLSPKCDYVADRDANGARNILLRYLTLRGIGPGIGSNLAGATPLL